MRTGPEGRCCRPFDPEPWRDKEIRWDRKAFVTDRVRSLFHIPLNFGAVMKRTVALLEAAGARTDPMIILSDDNSLWGADVYVEAAKDVPGAKMASLSGAFLSRVFEGPYGNAGRWVREMKDFVRSKDKEFGRLYFYYTTCPRCAKAYGKNYVVLLARV